MMWRSSEEFVEILWRVHDDFLERSEPPSITSGANVSLLRSCCFHIRANLSDTISEHERSKVKCPPSRRSGR